MNYKEMDEFVNDYGFSKNECNIDDLEKARKELQDGKFIRIDE